MNPKVKLGLYVLLGGALLVLGLLLSRTLASKDDPASGTSNVVSVLPTNSAASSTNLSSATASNAVAAEIGRAHV